MNFINYNFVLSLVALYFICCSSARPNLEVSDSKSGSSLKPIQSPKVVSLDNNTQLRDSNNISKELVGTSLNTNPADNENIVNPTDGLTTKNSASKIAKNGSSFSNYIRIKTVYELATDSNPTMFLPHDEFETVSEYKKRVSDQIVLMKEIVKLTTQKTDIKRNKRLKALKEKELKRKSVIETLMTESSSPIEFKPTDIGRYDPENQTFPLILFDTQYQISVPREEARTFKTNFESVKIKGIQQLKPKHDVKIKVARAHIRSRPNGSIIGVASQFEQYEHIVDIDEWYKINFKGQFGFTHMNNAELKLIDIDNEYEYHDLVAIHPNTGSMYTMISIDKLVKAPLNLASRKYESGKPDGPSQTY